METVKEFFEAIKGQLSERLANPFTGAFCIAWVIWNFRLLMVFAGKGSYQEKFLYIDSTLYLNWKYWALRGALLPLITTVAYLWAYPRATRWLAEDYRKQQTKASNLMKAADGQALLTLEESIDVRRQIALAKQAWTEERERITKELDAERALTIKLTQSLSGANLKLAETRSVPLEPLEEVRGPELLATFHEKLQPDASVQPSAYVSASDSMDVPTFSVNPLMARPLTSEAAQETYTRRQMEILSALRDGKRLTPSGIATAMDRDTFQVQRALDRLRDLHLIQYSTIDKVYGITPQGRAVLGAFVDAGKWSFTKAP